MRSLIIGAIGLDTIITPDVTYNNILGGAASYAAIASSLYSDPSLISIMGKNFPKEHIDLLRNQNINVNYIQSSKKDSFVWVAQYRENTWNQRETLSTKMNALLDLQAHIPAEVRDVEFVLCTNIPPNIQYKFLSQLTNSKLIVLDTISHWIKNFKSDLLETLTLVDVLILNEEELNLLTNEKNILKGLKKAGSFGPKRTIVKKGEHGALMYNGNSFFSVPAFPVETVIDPTGAGDSFAGSFLGYLSKFTDPSEDDFRTAVIIGILVSSFSIQNFSVESLVELNKDKVKKLFLEYKKTVSFNEIRD